MTSNSKVCLTCAGDRSHVAREHMCVWPFAWNSSAITGRILGKFDIRGFKKKKNSPKNSSFIKISRK